MRRVQPQYRAAPIPLPTGANPLARQGGDGPLSVGNQRMQVAVASSPMTQAAQPSNVVLFKGKPVSSGDAVPMREGRRLQRRIVPPSAPPSDARTASESFHTTVMTGTGQGQVIQRGAPQFSGFRRATQDEVGAAEEAGEAIAKAEIAPCGRFIIALRSFRLDLPPSVGGGQAIVERGEIIDEPGAIFLCYDQGAPIRALTEEEQRGVVGGEGSDPWDALASATVGRGKRGIEVVEEIEEPELIIDFPVFWREITLFFMFKKQAKEEEAMAAKEAIDLVLPPWCLD